MRHTHCDRRYSYIRKIKKYNRKKVAAYFRGDTVSVAKFLKLEHRYINLAYGDC